MRVAVPTNTIWLVTVGEAPCAPPERTSIVIEPSFTEITRPLSSCCPAAPGPPAPPRPSSPEPPAPPWPNRPVPPDGDADAVASLAALLRPTVIPAANPPPRSTRPRTAPMTICGVFMVGISLFVAQRLDRVEPRRAHRG